MQDSLAPFRQFGPFCGLYSIYVFTRIKGLNRPIESIVKADYVSSPAGSTLADLQRAAEENGLYGVPMKGLDHRFLSRSHCPIILHVKSNISSKTYDHYVLFLGMDGAKYRVFDPSLGLRKLSYQALSLHWDHYGMLISEQPIQKNVYSRSAVTWPRAGLVALGGVLFVLLLLKNVGFGRRHATGVAGQTAFVTGWATVVGLIFHTFSPVGFFRDPALVMLIQESQFESFLPKLSRREMQSAVTSGAAIVVDARHSSDYDAGHISNAISIPVTSGLDSIEATLKQYSREREIILYCQSDGCLYSGIIAKRMWELGYRNLTVYPGGWAEWTATAARVDPR